MTRPAEHLRALVDRAAGGGDGPMSERLRRAMAGESAERFRDRLLLERAAHLTRSGGRRLQDVASECGFRGYDVFVRAFRRELGASPSEWRAEPTSGAIDAPGEVHFHPPDGIRLPARRRTDALDLVTTMVERQVGAVGDLVARAARAGLSAKEEVTSALTRLVEQMEAFTGLVHDTGGDDVLPTDLRPRFDLAGPSYVDAVAMVGAAGRFDEAWVSAFTPEPVLRTLGDMVTAFVTDADGLLRAARRGIAEADSGAGGPT